MKKILFYVLIGTVVMFNCFMLFEGGFVSADTVSTSTIGSDVSLEYPVEVEVTSEITLTCDLSTTTLSLSIPGMTGGTATGAKECLVKTNNSDGFSMTADATTLTSENSDTFANGTTGAADVAEFSYNYDGGSWTAFTPDTPQSITSSATETSFAGTTSTMNFRAFVGSSKGQPSGLYTSLVTITAQMN